MKVFSSNFLGTLPDNPRVSGFHICNRFIAYINDSENVRDMDTALEFYAVLENYIEAHDTEWQLPEISIDDPTVKADDVIAVLRDFAAEKIKELRGFVKRDQRNRKLNAFREEAKQVIKGSFAYEFSQGDVKRIQALIHELRTYISECAELEEEHKQRLLKRLERLQSEVHKRVSDLDRFWGLVGDAGVAIGKLGKNAKPIVDRVREIAKITWNTQARAEELPSNMENPMIEHHQEN